MSKPQTSPQASLDTDDNLAPKVNAVALDFLLIELISTAQRVSDRVQAREQALLDEYRQSRVFSPQNQSTNGEETTAAPDGTANGETMTTLGFPVVSEKTQEGMLWRLDAMGYRVGQGLVERFSVNKPRPQTPLDSIKFICKDLWQLFAKQIDNLKTNHRGIFVLTDNRFKQLSRMSVDRRAGPKALEEALSRAQLYLHFPSGVIRGALAGLGIEATVSGETAEIPTATFQIKTRGAKP